MVVYQAMSIPHSIVVARFNEDVSWLEPLTFESGMFIYDKGEKLPEPCAFSLPNIGREAHTYLHHIVKLYRHINSDIIFCQGNPLDHCPDFVEQIQEPDVTLYGTQLDCTVGGAYDARSLVHEYCKVFQISVQPKYRFVAGAQFRVTKEQIYSHPVEFYSALLGATRVDPDAAYTLERLFPTIFGLV